MPWRPPPIIALLRLICVYLLSFICWKRCARQIVCIIRNTTDVLVLRSDVLSMDFRLMENVNRFVARGNTYWSQRSVLVEISLGSFRPLT
jgi:hypothetical protein